MTDKVLKGAGGGGGGGNSFTQTPDNLRSDDTFEGLMGVCIGPIKGPTNGLKSIRLDGTPIQNETGEMNFPGFVTVYSTGDPANWPESPEMRLGSASAPMSVGTALVNTSGAGVWVTRTLNNLGADYIDLRFIVEQLYHQTKSGIFTNTATLEIEMKPTGSANWINPTLAATASSSNYVFRGNGFLSSLFDVVLDTALTSSGVTTGAGGTGTYVAKNFAITGKTTSPVVYELRIAVPNTDAYANVTWDIRVRLIEKDTLDDDPNFDKRTINWESIAAVYTDKLGEEPDWKGVSWIQFYGKASNQLTGVPEVEMETDAKIVSVPPSTVFNPDTRQYVTNAIWDGSWSKAWTNDPAWIINDAISDELSGLSLVAPGSYLNKWDALEASKFFSELVPDGKGGTHPRYSMNVVSNNQIKAEEFIRYLAGAVSGFAWDDGDGQWRMKVDKPDNPVDIFTLENIEGEFVYSHTDVDSRFNNWTGTFLNEEFDYREDSVSLYDNASIALLGHKPTSIELVGCTNRQEALRRLMVRMRSSINENKLVNFTTNRRGRNIQQLDTILIADGDLGDSAKRTTGRTITIAADRKSITVRDPMWLELGVNYTMRFAYVNPTYNPDSSTQPTGDDWTKPTIVATRNIVNDATQRGSTVTLHLDSALPDGLPNFLAVALEATDLPTLPLLYRVTNVTYDDDGEHVSVSALIIDTGKWDAADNVSNINTVFQDLRGTVPVPLLPASGDLLTIAVTPGDQGSHVSLIANWTRPPGANISGFKVVYNVNGGNDTVLVENTTIPQADLVDPANGDYQFKIYTINRSGQLSTPLIATQTVDPTTIAAADIYYSDGTHTLDDLQPAQAGADVTGQHTSADTAFVNGTPSSSITSQLASQTTSISGILTNVSDLQTTYGSTASAAASATSAAASAATATTQATSATNQAALAQTSAVLASSVARGGINPNPIFASWSTGDTSPPNSWNLWNTASILRKTDPDVTEGSPNYAQVTATAGTMGGYYEQIPLGPGWFVVDVTAKLDSGTWDSAGIYFVGYEMISGVPSNPVALKAFEFSTNADTNGVTSATLTTTRRFSFLVQTTRPTAAIARIYMMSNYNSAGFSSTMPAKVVRWYRVSVRSANAAEIAAQTAIPLLSATVTSQAGTLATLEGRSLAYWQQTVQAGLGNGATAFVTLQAESSWGAGAVSTIAMGAQEFRIYNPLNNGNWQPVLSVTSGQVSVSGNLAVGAGIFLGSGSLWSVALKGKDFVVSDGTVVSYDINLGNVPLMDFSTIGLAPLATGETYLLYGDNSSPTGFTARLKIQVPGTTVANNLTVDTAGTPTRQIDKTGMANAANNIYTIHCTGTFTDFAVLIDDGGGVT